MASDAHNVWDLRSAARSKLPKAIFEFVDRGSEDELNLLHNRTALDRLKLIPRNLRDVSSCDTSIELFGVRRPTPLIVSATGIADLMWYRGELALAAAAREAGVPFTLATSSTTSIASIAEAATTGFWMQMYLWERRDLSWEVVQRAEAAGAEVLVLTVDTPVLPNREFNRRNGMANPIKPSLRLAFDFATHPGWSLSVLARYVTSGGMPRFVNYPQTVQGSVTGPISRLANSASVTWDDVKELRRRWPRKLVIKGILNPHDAELVADLGADGVVVSNHGGRNFDSGPAAIDVLPEIVDRVGGKVAVLFDSGVRRGTDVIKAIALGADAVLIGRATLYGLAYGGKAGAVQALSILNTEISMAMAMLGVNSLDQLDRDIVRADWGPLTELATPYSATGSAEHADGSVTLARRPAA